MKSQEKRVQAARLNLILDQPFFGVLALRLKIKADPSCKTAWVDGRTMGYNPEFVENLTHGQLVGLIAHEVMHCACGHPWRRDDRDAKRWNVAADHAINPILVKSGFKLPEGALLDPAYDGKNAEWIYARQPEPQPQPQDDEEGSESSQSSSGQGDGDQSDQGEASDEPADDQSGDQPGDDQDAQDDQEGQGEPEQPGEVRDAPDDATEDGSTEGDWKAAVQQAANAAKAQGKLPGDLERFAADTAEPAVDWRSALRRFVQDTASADYTWRTPSPRYVARGLYMPSLRSEEMGPLVVAIDTSGSCDSVLLAQFEAEVVAIVDEMSPSQVHVMYCDARVHRTDTFERGEEIKFNPVGGGGTAFAPVFEAIKDLDEDPVAVVYLTDLWGSFPTEVPEVPTLWATTHEREVPFGEVLLVNA